MLGAGSQGDPWPVCTRETRACVPNVWSREGELVGPVAFELLVGQVVVWSEYHQPKGPEEEVYGSGRDVVLSVLGSSTTSMC